MTNGTTKRPAIPGRTRVWTPSENLLLEATAPPKPPGSWATFMLGLAIGGVVVLFLVGLIGLAGCCDQPETVGTLTPDASAAEVSHGAQPCTPVPASVVPCMDAAGNYLVTTLPDSNQWSCALCDQAVGCAAANRLCVQSCGECGVP